jgi:hypothetical protein
MIETVQNLMDQSLLLNENAVYSELINLPLNQSLMDFLKILNIHKKKLYTNIEKNNRDFLKFRKSLESFGDNVQLLIEDIVKNKFEEANKMIIKKLEEQNEYFIKQNEIMNNIKKQVLFFIMFVILSFIVYCYDATSGYKQRVPT